MDNKEPNLQNLPPKPSPPLQNNQSIQPISPQPQVNFSANSLDIANPPKNTKKVIFYAVITVIIFVIIVGIFLAIQKKTNDSSNTLNSNTQNQNNKNSASNDNSINPDQNPLNNNAPINSEVKYCSNPVNAELVC